MNYLDKKSYELLYERYLERSPDPLLDAAELKEGESVLDLCGGSGRLAIAARKRGAGIINVVDADINMADEEGLKKHCIDLVNSSVGCFLGQSIVKWDTIFSQQAVNYWLTRLSATIIHKRLKDGGRFVFNTFHYRPPEDPTFKGYKAANEDVVAECYYTVGNVVHHFQMREGCEPHYTSFAWISPDEFMDWLSPTLDVEVLRPNRNTDIYVCRKK